MSYEIVTTELFDQWLAQLKDKPAVSAIRLLRAEVGHLGDVKSVGDGVKCAFL